VVAVEEVGAVDAVAEAGLMIGMITLKQKREK
jgi:hypothetical protein